MIRMGMGRMMVRVVMAVGAIAVMVVMIVIMCVLVIVVMIMAVIVIAMMMVVMPSSSCVIMVVIMPMIAIGADALDMMVMAGLRQAHFGLEADDLLPVFAHLAVHVVLAAENLAHPVGEGVEHQRVIVEILRLQELDLRMRAAISSVML